MKKSLLLLIIPFLSFGQEPISDENIYSAVELWISDQNLAENIYGNISEWDVSNVTNMDDLFSGWEYEEFNDNIANWDVSSVTSMNNMFRICTSFNQDISNWDVSNVTDMSLMFRSCESFNQDISGWDVSSVNNMDGMFMFAESFNQDIGGWDVGSVTDMSAMFYNASSFDQDISGWDVGGVSTMNNMFYCDSWDCDSYIALSTSNYDALLNGWSQLEGLQTGVYFNAGGSKYCEGVDGKLILMLDFGWSIIDGGQECGGCTDEDACNYSSSTLNDDGSCEYPAQYYDCDNNCLNDNDGDGVCNELEIEGCTNEEACNYESNATDDNGSCDYSCYCDTVYIDNFITDTLYLDNFIIDTIVEIIYENYYIYDTIVETEYIDVVITEYVDCDTGLPCSSGMAEIVEKSKKNGKIYNLLGQEIIRREGIYIEGGEIKYRF